MEIYSLLIVGRSVNYALSNDTRSSNTACVSNLLAGSPGASIVNNMMIARFHKGPSALTYIWFYGMVRLHGPWDYKSLSGRQYADYGNFNYGAVGTAAGISEQILLRGAGWAQSRSGNGDPQKFGTGMNQHPMEMILRIRSG